MIQDRQEIIHLLKHGRSDEIRAMVEQQKRKNYSNEFVPFMAQMLQEYKISRKNVAVRSGLSQDYVYKLLRGDKHTDERDYILAMCFAIGMNLAQTQHALSSYGMPILSEGDIRSCIIILAIRDGIGIDELNTMLEKAGFPLLKTSPDMPSAVITDTSLTAESEKTRKERHFEEIDSFTDGHHNGGNAPFDYDYQGWIKVRDEDGRIYQVEAVFTSDYTSFIVFTEEQRREAVRLMELHQKAEAAFYEAHKEILDATGGNISLFENQDLYMEYLGVGADIPEAEKLELYDSLEEAASSDFFPLFLEIDKRTDKKVQEIMKKVDDTREYGMRVGASWGGGGQPKMYIEMFNDRQPELREYYQIVEYRDGTSRFTATHESCYMQIEMGQELYEIYFGKKREPEYYIDTDKNEFTGSWVRYRFIFNNMKMIMHEYMMKHGGGFDLTPNQVMEERIELLIEQGVQSHMLGNDDESLRFYREAMHTLEAIGAPEKGHLTGYICTCFKIASTLAFQNDPEAKNWW